MTAPVLIGFAEALAAPEAAWSLVDDGFEVLAFTRRGARPALRRSRRVRLVEITAPEQDAAQAARELSAAVALERPCAVLPLDDASLWLADRALAGTGATIAGATGEQARLALDKSLQLAAARDAGLVVPWTRSIDSAADLPDIDEFPVVLKPALALEEHDGRVARGPARVCADRQELEAAARSLRPGRPMLAQPLIAGTGEGLFGLAGPDGVLAWSAHRRVRMMNPQGSGSSACRAVAVDPQLAAAAERMLLEAGWQGLFMIELLRDEAGRAWFMELNGRAWGSMALARRGGLEYPAWAVRQALEPGFEPPATAARDTGTCRHLGRDLVHLLMVLRGPRSAALTRWPSRWSTVRDVLRFSRHDHWYNWRRGEAALFFDDAVTTVTRTLRRA